MFKVAPLTYILLLQNIKAALLDRAILENLDVVFDQTLLLPAEKLDKKLTNAGYKFIAVVVDPPTKQVLYERIEERNRGYSEKGEGYKVVALSEEICEHVARAQAEGKEEVTPLVALFDESYAAAKEMASKGLILVDGVFWPDGYEGLILVDGSNGKMEERIVVRPEWSDLMEVNQY